MKSFATFQFAGESIEKARGALEMALGVQMVARESMDLGDYYKCSLSSGEILSLQNNFDEIDEEPRYGRFEKEAIILFVEATTRRQDLEQILLKAGFKLVEHKEA